MAKDPILDQLGRERDAARERQQTAFEAMKRAGDARHQASEATSRAFEKKKVAQDTTSRAFEKKKAAQDAQNRIFERKKAAQDATTRAFNQKKEAQDAFFREKENIQRQRDNLSSSIDAYRRSADSHRSQANYLSGLARGTMDRYSKGSYRDGAQRERELARSDSQQAQYYISQIRSLGAGLESYRSRLNSAKNEFDAAKRVSDPLKAEFDAARNKTQSARNEFDAAKRVSDSLKADFDKLKAKSDEAKKTHEAAKAKFEQAKVEFARAKEVFDARLAIVREANKPKTQDVLQRLAERALLDSGVVGIKQVGLRRDLQYEDEDARVVVRYDYNRNFRARVTDILVYDRHNKEQHYHHVVDEHGNVILSEWRANRGR